MKKIIKLLLLFPFVVWGQNDQNFVQTTTYRDKNSEKPAVSITYFDGLGRPIQKIAQKQSATGNDIVTPITYDGFGRQDKEYLPYAATTSDMLFQTNALVDQSTFYMNPKYENTSNAYSQKEFEASPLNRVFKQAAPGNEWKLGNGKEIKFAYEANDSTDKVLLFKVTTNWISTKQFYDISISASGNYAVNELYKNITTDENGKSTHEFKDKEGRVILKRCFDGTTKLDTYYVYDDYGNLTYVLPPLAKGQYTQSILDGLCYQYRYDHRNRLAAKKLPGKDWEFIVYDNLDRVVATGPVFSPFTDLVGSKGWLITKYDVFNRPVLTAWYSATVDESTRGSLQTSMNSTSTISEVKSATTVIKGVTFNYSTNAWPQTGYDVLTVNYYDDYSFPHAETIPTTILGETVYYNTTRKPRGLATASWVRVLEKTSDAKAQTSLMYYDTKARPICVKTNNHLGGYTQVDSQLDFMGKVLKTVTRHKRSTNDAELLTTEEFTYSAQDRLLTHTHEMSNGTKETLVRNTYDELGQLTSKNVGGSSSAGLQKVDYEYNIRGWLKAINDITQLQKPSEALDLFAFKLNYNENDKTPKTPSEVSVNPLYNGNISETFWTTANDNGLIRKYGYSYDDLNRLRNASFQKLGPGKRDMTYDEVMEYDENGNIKKMIRNGWNSDLYVTETIDNLQYNYAPNNPNQLLSVTDLERNSDGFNDGNTNGADYDYDGFGNMTIDRNKNISKIDYNHLNLPVKIVFGGNEKRKIEYLYDATGKKLEKRVFHSQMMSYPYGSVNAEASSMRNASNTESSRGIRPSYKEVDVTTITQYLQGGYQYKNGRLDFIPHAEGFAKIENGVRYFYNYTDHLGNVRVTYTEDPFEGGLQLVEESHYYPFGLKHKGYNDPVCYEREYGGPCISDMDEIGYKYKYNGKELQDELGLNMYAYGFRDYDASLARWMNIDQLSEKYHTTSPYAFVQNNPILNREIDGRYFDEKNEKKAARIERKAEKQASKLDRKADKLAARGQSTGDLRDRANELRQSAQDVRDMRNDANTEYRYANVGSKEAKSLGIVGPSTLGTGQNSNGHNVVSMFTEKGMGSILHEGRHGGQNARGEINAITQSSSIAAEVSAYRAQYSWEGLLNGDTMDMSRIPNIINFQTNPNNRVLMDDNRMPIGVTTTNITNINQINAGFVNNLVEIGVGGGYGTLPTVQNYLIWIYAGLPQR